MQIAALYNFFKTKSFFNKLYSYKFESQDFLRNSFFKKKLKIYQGVRYIFVEHSLKGFPLCLFKKKKFYFYSVILFFEKVAIFAYVTPSLEIDDALHSDRLSRDILIIIDPIITIFSINKVANFLSICSIAHHVLFFDTVSISLV